MYGIIVALWGTIYLEFWKRKQRTLALEWGMIKCACAGVV